MAGLDFQFSEVSKVLMIVVLAGFLASRREKIGKLSTLVGAGLLMAIPTFLVFKQRTWSTALVFVAILVGMLFMSGASIGADGVLAGATVAAAPIVVQTLQDYQRARLFCFLDPYADPQGACYQLVQALNAVGSGGLFGQGLTAGRQNQLGFLPVQSTDFIFTVVAEELGFIGSVMLLAIFALLIWRILAIGWGARDVLGMMVAVGLASMLLFQIMVNIGMVIGIMRTGIPPFVTYGGMTMISLLGMGIMQSVRMHALKPTFLAGPWLDRCAQVQPLGSVRGRLGLRRLGRCLGHRPPRVAALPPWARPSGRRHRDRRHAGAGTYSGTRRARWPPPAPPGLPRRSRTGRRPPAT